MRIKFDDLLRIIHGGVWIVKRSKIIKIALIGFLLFGIFSIGRVDCGAENKAKIIWQKPFQENSTTIIPGSLRTGSGLLEIRWIIPAKGIARLITMESSGSAELPPREKRLLLWVGKSNSTVLFQKQFPLANIKEPVMIRPVVAVSTKDLFSVLPKTKLPPVAKPDKTPKTITWESLHTKGDTLYLPGSLQASFGRLNIYWRKKGTGIPELITLESRGSGELSSREVSLYIWKDEKQGFSTLFQERYPLLNQGLTSYLWPLAVVRTDELMDGFQKTEDDDWH
jgi:hypothetical protein